MLKRIMKKFALSREGARGFILAVMTTALDGLVLMIPVSLLYYLLKDLLKGKIPTNHYYLYIIGIIITMIIMILVNIWKYNATYFTTYRESGVKRVRLAEKLRKLPLSFFGKKDLADLTNVILGDVARMEKMMSHCVAQFYGSIISTCIIAIGMFIFDWRMALATIWVLPVSLITVIASKKAQTYFVEKQNESSIEVLDGIQENLEAMKELKSNNAEEKYLIGLNEKIDKFEKRQIKSEFGTALFVVPAQMILKLGIATVVLVGSSLLIRGSITIEIFLMFMLVVSRMYEPLAAAMQNLAAINSLQVNIDRMNEIENYEEQSGDKSFNPNGYDIEFKNVAFAYNSEEKILRNVSFVAKQGEVTALIGESGGGKSTAAKLAARFWDVQKGEITVGGINVKTVDPEELLKVYSIVFQDVTLFNNTIMENIRIGKVGATDEEVIEAAKKAQCEEFVNKLPNGYETIIGENGSMLSGGERQRISIARAILKDAPIVIMDEATASLDAENETEVQKALSTLISGKTVLIIAHRMRTVDGAEKIVVLSNGEIVEQGTPSELRNKDGIYAKMLKLQSSEL